ncbi:BgTH12-03222 [Blumeria graminis f. sp. triticale]|uniref:Vacuolar protein-sorting-associated protein 25 n=1 Tax=Blumeria graminis f. sp. triticale TaxID=1689686 RepID=A0A9W4D470_BLUGR|nr:BgTH12-03222 [Blumeria graminis f. sp. triticale]
MLANLVAAGASPFVFPPVYGFPPFFTPQPNAATRHAQLEKWSGLVRAYARHHKLYKLSLSDALDSELFHNQSLGRRLSPDDARDVVEFMRREGRAEWVGATKGKDVASGVFWVWWKTIEEWGEAVASWVEETGQKNMVLTLYELTESEATMSQEFHKLHPEILQKALAYLVKRGKAQVFGQEDEQGVKFF